MNDETVSPAPQEAPVRADDALPISQLKLDKNVRKQLRLKPWFLKSVRENGVRIPIVVIDQGDNTYRVVAGKRRVMAAERAKRASVPAYIISADVQEAGREYIDQLIENCDQGRESFTALEEADALLLADQSGMELPEIARLAGRTQKDVKKALHTAKTIGSRTRRTLAQDDPDNYDWTLDELGVLAEFDDDPDAVERLKQAHAKGFLDHQATRERMDREEERACAERRAALAKAGITLYEDVEDLPDAACWIEELLAPEGREFTAETHKECPGHIATWDYDNTTNDGPGSVAYLCADPEANGHWGEEDGAPEENVSERDEANPEDGQESHQGETDPEDPVDGADGEDDAQTATDSPPHTHKDTPTPAKQQEEQQEEEGIPYRLKVEANREYRAALKRRREWLRDELLPRKTAPKGLPEWVSRQLLTCPKPVQSWAGDAARTIVLSELLGIGDDSTTRDGWLPENANAARLNLSNFAIIAACYEHRISEVQTWRTDRPQWDTEAIRSDARAYLGFLASIGYRLSPIEHAIVDDEPFTLPEETDDALDAEDSPETDDDGS
ncbi:ParB N-terminal domain-containing protein (plasmid) [Streptomyces sp. NBC_01186]|uniref:ParB/RepB/Spo0J family partition protein n=1 Tax=Streptomyces sp. NBC_01186 TaxID=2903765 RepID=UPI002E0F03EF|nr:ParB N-terminal domain-containing protein [Streptomyces sp. NBC_01186]